MRSSGKSHVPRGIENTEPLKDVLSGCWSIRINEEHRIVTIVDGSVSIAQPRYHR